jgi:hypothetical protein
VLTDLFDEPLQFGKPGFQFVAQFVRQLHSRRRNGADILDFVIGGTIGAGACGEQRRREEEKDGAHRELREGKRCPRTVREAHGAANEEYGVLPHTPSR